MTRRAIFTRETIIEVAFELTREKGWGPVTARSIARRLGCSTMPIYSSMKSMVEIEAEVRVKAESLLLDYQGRRYTDDLGLNKAVGYVAFARHERNLFRFLYVGRSVAGTARAGEGPPTGRLDDLTGGKTVPRLADQARVAMQDPRILKSWIFTHGLASMIGNGVLDLPDEAIRALLEEAGGAFFGVKEYNTAARRAGARSTGGAGDGDNMHRRQR